MNCYGKDIEPFAWDYDAGGVWLWRCHCCQAVSLTYNCRKCGQYIASSTW